MAKESIGYKQLSGFDKKITAFFAMKHFKNLKFFLKGTGPFFSGHLKPKIVKIGPVMNSGGAAQNNRIFFYNRWKQSLSAYPELTENGWKLENGQLDIRWGNEMFPSDLEEVLIQTSEDIDSDDETDNSQTNIPYDCSYSDEDSDEEFNLEF